MSRISEESMRRLESIKELTSIPSPTGYTYNIVQHIYDKLKDMGVEPYITAKGAILVTLEGRDTERHRFVTAHVDTLGAIVRSIKADGRLKIDRIGGFPYNMIEGEYCTIHSSLEDKEYTGTILLHQTSTHVYREAGKLERTQDNMEVRLDYPVTTREEVEQLGIRIGDFISFDARPVITEEGFIKSRHLDDKVSVALLLEVIELVQSGALELAHTTHFFISNNEEIGYGGNSNIASQVVEYLAVDMGAIGDDQATDEYTVSICVKDASGPYHLGLRNQLVQLCQDNEIDYRLDIYPFYMSDASAAMSAGVDVRHGLIGSGIDASHAYERTHAKSVDATFELIKKYLATPCIS